MPTPDGTMPTSKHVEAIINMPPPLGDDGLADKTMVRSLIGMIKYIRRYIQKCGLLCGPLNQLCADDSDRAWSPVHAMVLARLKCIIAITMGMKHADFKKPLYICSDGSKRGIGGFCFKRVPMVKNGLSHIFHGRLRRTSGSGTRESSRFSR